MMIVSYQYNLCLLSVSKKYIFGTNIFSTFYCCYGKIGLTEQIIFGCCILYEKVQEMVRKSNAVTEIV